MPGYLQPQKWANAEAYKSGLTVERAFVPLTIVDKQH